MQCLGVPALMRHSRPAYSLRTTYIPPHALGNGNQSNTLTGSVQTRAGLQLGQAKQKTTGPLETTNT